MNDKLFEQLEELYNALDGCNEISEMYSLKKQIKEDKTLSNLLDQYHSLNKYDPEIKNIKSQIINHPLVVRYKKLENELYFTVLEANNKLNTLVDKKRCNNEDN